ncbi:hypothetical protein KDAU_69270 [Dictyobacter aurantiacus]|uniref:DEAD/DEAH box helicase n=2 Tax=Dictyobacter aurantiacus TaxID=1936993 RepID=A0A401ZRP8_9CHLR|nr:DEAD/DEAH box helicase [Dictyobacter aurantiacus]GCE09598.1 hypothetical protein KDAU_69270 [Dictyobacter aurantiacus]
MPSFSEFALQPATRAVLADMKVTQPSPIQAGAIPVLLDGKDLVGQSATGSGKTLAYSIPLVERLAKDKRFVQALVLVPTRELAVQVNNVLSRLAAARRLSTALLVGGRPYNPQISALRYGAQIVVGTPGRVKDHLERGSLNLTRLRICVLDEADQMLDSGFAPEIEQILTTTPETRQMALFSATMPDWVAKIQEKFLKDPAMVAIQPAIGAESTIEQIAYQIPQNQKMAALCTLLNSTDGESSLIFGKTKYGVEKLGKQLTNLGFAVGTLHGNKSQRAREEVLAAFRHGRVQTLLATNVAARGLDIRGIRQVINYELPESSELFTHRIGRTGRMGDHGKAITLLTPGDVSKWRRMSRNLGQAVSLQQLTIDEDAMIARPVAKPVMVAEPQFEQPSGARPARNRKFASPATVAPKGSRMEAEDKNPAEVKPRPKKIRVNTAPVWKSEEFVEPDRFAGRREHSSKRPAGRSAHFGGHKVKQRTHISFEAEAQHHDNDRKSGRVRRRVASSGRPGQR